MPDRLAGADLQRVDRAVARAGDEETHAADRGDHRGGVVRVEGGDPGLDHQRTSPVRLSNAMKRFPTSSLVSPARVEEADDQQVLIHDRRLDAAPVPAELPELLLERAGPEELAVGVEGHQEPLDAVGVDVPRLGVARRARPADAVRGDVGEEDRHPVLPEKRAVGLGEADDALVLGGAIAAAREEVDVAVLDDRAGAAADGRLPGQVLPLHRPARGQARLRGGAIPGGPAPVAPLGGGGGGGEDQSDGGAAGGAPAGAGRRARRTGAGGGRERISHGLLSSDTTNLRAFILEAREGAGRGDLHLRPEEERVLDGAAHLLGERGGVGAVLGLHHEDEVGPPVRPAGAQDACLPLGHPSHRAKHRLDGRGVDVVAPDEDHVVGAAQDPAAEPELARAAAGRRLHQVAGAVADDGGCPRRSRVVTTSSPRLSGAAGPPVAGSTTSAIAWDAMRRSSPGDAAVS